MGIFLIILGVLLLIVGGLTLQALKNIPAEPPTVAVVTFLGERMKKNGKPIIKKRVGVYFGCILGYTDMCR